MFPEQLPLTLPEQRDTDHRIELVDGAKPPAHCIYRMTPEQEVQLNEISMNTWQQDKLNNYFYLQ